MKVEVAYTDLESGGGGGGNNTTFGRGFNLRRKWHKLPRVLRYYIAFGSVFMLVFIFAYNYFGQPLLSKGNDLTNFIQISQDQQQSNLPAGTAVAVQPAPPLYDNVSEDDANVVAVDDFVLSDSSYLNREDFKQASTRQNKMQAQIRQAIEHSWNGYKKYAWGKDHLKPISKTGHNWFHIGLTILDSLDTLLIAGMDKEYDHALEWVTNQLSFDINQEVNCFETTIRALGGLLSAYHISHDAILLERANDLGDRLIHCFDSPSKSVPFSDVNLRTKQAKTPKWSSDSSLSEVSSMQLEFRDLAHETSNQMYEQKTFATSIHIHELVKKRRDPLLPMYINPISGQLTPAVVTLGARADSYYEYLYKQHLQTRIDWLLEDYIEAVSKIKEKLWSTTKGPLKLAFIGELLPSNHIFNPKMDHLVCFLSGTLALGYYHENRRPPTEKYRGHPISVSEITNRTFSEHLKMAEELARTCHYMYNLTETGLSPEIAYFGTDSNDKEYIIRPADTHNLLRPEFVESLFFLYHITGNQIYREYGRQVFEAFEKYTRVPSGGYTTINNVRNPKNVNNRDMMESFWLAETLKYLYLLFLDDRRIVDRLLNSYVFNTEGHLILRQNDAVATAADA